MSEEKLEQIFQVSQPTKLNVSNIRGLVEIRSGEDGVIQVTAVKHTLTGDEKHTEIEISQETDGTVRVVTHFPKDGWGWLFGSNPCKVDYIITAPRACTLNIKCISSDMLVDGFDGDVSVNSVSGDMQLKSLTGSLKAQAVSGDIQLQAVSGTLSVNSVSGDIRGQNLSGPVKLDTVSGDVELSASSFPSVQAGTTSGDMRIATSLGEGPYHFHSISGDVRLTVPAETRCSAEIHSISGHISTSLPGSFSSRHRSSQIIDVQGGGVKVFLNSISGELSLAS